MQEVSVIANGSSWLLVRGFNRKIQHAMLPSYGALKLGFCLEVTLKPEVPIELVCFSYRSVRPED